MNDIIGNQIVTQPPSQRLTIEDAAICEKIRDYRPHGRTIVISISLGLVNRFGACAPGRFRLPG